MAINVQQLVGNICGPYRKLGVINVGIILY